jgi:hypothetical protein
MHGRLVLPSLVLVVHVLGWPSELEEYREDGPLEKDPPLQPVVADVHPVLEIPQLRYLGDADLMVQQPPHALVTGFEFEREGRRDGSRAVPLPPLHIMAATFHAAIQRYNCKVRLSPHFVLFRPTCHAPLCPIYHRPHLCTIARVSRRLNSAGALASLQWAPPRRG